MFAYSYALLRRVVADRKGVTALEYGVIAAVTVVAVAAAIVPVQTALNTLFGNVVTAL
jgi:pilus assembly protein Flp/PilA